MKTGLLDRANHVAIADAAVPSVGEGEVLLQVVYAGVCGSDLHAYRGLHPFRKPPVVLGHEVAGVIVEVGPGVGGLALGDRVTVMPSLGCGECELCRAGRANICLGKKVPGSGAWLGAFAEYFAAPASVTYKVPEGMELDVAVLAEPLATALHSVKMAQVREGDRVLILGGGTIGLLAAGVARAYGAAEVVLTDVLDFNLAMAKANFGADSYSALDPDLEGKLGERYPGKFTSVILCASAEETVHQAIRLVRRGGRVVVTGLYLTPIAFNFFDLTLGEIVMTGSQNYTDVDFREGLGMLGEGCYPFSSIITHRFPLVEADMAMRLLSTHSEDVVKILLAAMS